MSWWTFWGESFAQALGLLVSGDAAVWSTIRVSLQVSGTALLAATALGLPLAATLALGRFPGRGALRVLVHAGMGLPSVIVGLLVLLLLTRRGPLGGLELLWTPGAMVLAQCVLILPLWVGLAAAALEAVPTEVGEAAASLGARPWRRALVVIAAARRELLTAVLAAFGRAISEVGAVLLVGGNIAWSDGTSYTRTLTTAMVVETRQGRFEAALALGLILFGLVLVINLAVLRLGRGAGNV